MFVPDGLKDDRYWNRRSKNNVAAKRSRDARRLKENQIALRAAFLEKENEKLSGAYVEWNGWIEFDLLNEIIKMGVRTISDLKITRRTIHDFG